MSIRRAARIFVVAGVGNGSGTGAASARLFAQQGYSVALVARGADSLNKVADEIRASGGDAAAFPIADYKPESVSSAFSSITSHWPSTPLRVALFNVGHNVRGPFLSITPAQVQESLDTNVIAAFAFAREAVLRFKDQDVDELGRRGALIFTGATASLKGNTTTSAFAASKHGVRALSQSLNKEFGKDNIHVAHTVMDGMINNEKTRSLINSDAWANNKDVHIDPESIAKNYLFLAEQDRSAWTWELDLRPAHEKW